MVIVIPYKSKTTKYRFLQQGIHIAEDSATWWVYLGIGLLILFPLGWTTSISVPLAFGIATSLAIVLGILLFRIKQVQGIFHKRTIVPWASVEKAEMFETKLKFTLQDGTYSSGSGIFKKYDEIEFFIKKGDEKEVQTLLTNILSDRFTVRP